MNDLDPAATNVEMWTSTGWMHAGTMSTPAERTAYFGTNHRAALFVLMNSVSTGLDFMTGTENRDQTAVKSYF